MSLALLVMWFFIFMFLHYVIKDIFMAFGLSVVITLVLAVAPILILVFLGYVIYKFTVEE